jgi:anti-sigma factor RsiW
MEANALHELTPAYALDALGADEEREYEEHLARCEHCRSELTSLSEAATSLAYGIESPPLPPQLRERILEGARAERPNVVPLRPRWAVPAAATAVAALAAVIALAIWASSLSSRLDHSQSLRAEQARVAEIVGAPDAQPFTIANQGRLVVTPGGEAALVLTHLTPAGPGKTYEAWIIQSGKARRAGTFQAGKGVTAVALDELVPPGAIVAVTKEKAPGVDAPTQKPFVAVNTAA